VTQTDERIVIPAGWHLEFEHAAGRAASRFLTALRDQAVLLASPCPSCGRVRLPPRSFCEDCFVPTSDDWVEVGPEGVIEAFAITYAAFPGYREPPHAIAYVISDGADTAMCNWVEGVDLSDQDSAVAALKAGTRVHAVFSSERQARVTDFHWELLDENARS
jgi:uncharacterized OB-fold protein